MKSQLLQAVALLLCLAATTPYECLAAAQDAESGPPAVSVSTAGSAAQEGPASLFDKEEGPLEANNGSILVRIHTSRDKGAKDVCTLYPYPIKPPVCEKLAPLPVKGKALDNMIRNTGFLNRPDPSRPFPVGGWRWIYAYKTALAKSGLSEPHTILGEYEFARSLAPYASFECRLRNAFEKQRRQRYENAIDQFNLTHEEAELTAVKLGYMPMALRSTEYGTARGQMPPGSWWLQVTRKVPGLKYYWLQPVTSYSGKRTEVNLNDDNALAIIGAW